MFLASKASNSKKIKIFKIFTFGFSKKDIFHPKMKNDAVLSKIYVIWDLLPEKNENDIFQFANRYFSLPPISKMTDL